MSTAPKLERSERRSGHCAYIAVAPPRDFQASLTFRRLQFETTIGEATCCSYCANHCLRTFINYGTDERRERMIVASCEKGASHDQQELRETVHRLRRVQDANPNPVEIAARTVVLPPCPRIIADASSRFAFTPRQCARNRLINGCGDVRIGIARVFNQYLYAPFFSAYLESLGVSPRNIVWSDVTSDRLYREGAGNGAIDPCYPSKVVVAHVHNLIFKHHVRSRYTLSFFRN